MTRLHLFWNMSLQKNLPIFNGVQFWVNLNRCNMSICLCYLKIMLGNMPENFRGETQHSISQISSKKAKELKNDLSWSDSIISVSTSASNAQQQMWICTGPLVFIWSKPPVKQGHLGPDANLFNCRTTTKIMKKKVTCLVKTLKMMSSRKPN